MKRMLFNATYQEELRVATVEGQKLIDFDIETTSKTQRRGNIYKGVITRVEQSLEACFVDYGTEKQGFLPFKEIESIYLPESSNRNRDYSKLREGMELIVQVEKDERGNKGAALTTSISLPGRYLVLMPNNSRAGGISRRIDGEERDELKATLSALEMPTNMSVIARTAALGRFTEELQWDLNYLVKLWEAITNAATSTAGSFLIYQESNIVVRSIRDHFSPDITEILIDTPEIYEKAREFISNVMPNFTEKVKLYTDDIPLFSRFQIEHQIESAYSRLVHLPSGGSIAIDHTEALTAIDVNSARANKGADIEATAFAANMEAAEEIARQLRLRDLGGLIVVDFIDMENSKNQREVENCFKQQLGIDRARIQMSKLSKFGLLELSRQRIQASLGDTTTITCPRCNGVGTIRGNESSAVHVLRIIEEEAVKNSHSLAALHVQLPVDIATYLLNEKREDVSKIETRMKVKIILVPNLHLNSPEYKIKRINYDNIDAANKLSYTLVESPAEENINVNVNNTDGQNKAVVKNITPTQPAPKVKKTFLSGFIKQLASIFSPQPKKKISNSKITNKPKNERNKLRPVTVNKGAHKVQTVKANAIVNKVAQQTAITNDAPTNNKHTNRPNRVSSKPVEDTPNHNERVQHANKKIERELRPQRLPKKPVEQKSNNNEELTTQSNHHTHEKKTHAHVTENVVNKSDSTSQITPQIIASTIQKTNDLVVTPPPAINTIDTNKPVENVKLETRAPAAEKKNIVVKPSTEQVATVSETPAAEIVIAAKTAVINENEIKERISKAIVERINTITEKVDLGELQLVNTDTALVINQAPIIEEDLQIKRYNDLKTKPVETKQNVEYEMVETKSNN